MVNELSVFELLRFDCIIFHRLRNKIVPFRCTPFKKSGGSGGRGGGGIGLGGGGGGQNPFARVASHKSVSVPFTVNILKFRTLSLRKYAYSNILRILPSKNENFQIKHSDIYHIPAQNIDCGWF